ncbi:glycylpeptide N-tetradecanoyltransferase-like [Penaeus monodon]|uniref:glycylpeptide N-tetradecanoyltransferase-like n=1 Tax=Penaeus monodon TaxID=6687 RepID=UPI0018A73284|nr:glycylpeptide N-tetradecanoyltransferase-like [Penaeus monodon]
MAAAPDRSEGVNADHGPHSKATGKDAKHGPIDAAAFVLQVLAKISNFPHVYSGMVDYLGFPGKLLSSKLSVRAHIFLVILVYYVVLTLVKDIKEILEYALMIQPEFYFFIFIFSLFQLQNLYNLLNENYVEDDDNMFRFDYSKEFLRWALMPPSWKPQWHVGVRVTKSNRLVGFISAVPAHIRIYDHTQAMVEINFLCVHKKLRAKRLAPVLIKEITRRVNLTGIFQAVYTAGVTLPKPVASCRYWHRSLNPKKLIDVKFSHLGKNMTMQRTLKLYRLPTETATTGFRRLKVEDVDQAHTLLETYLKKFDLAPVFSREEFMHWFLPQDNIIDSYVVENNGKISDFMSYYTLPSTVMHHPTYKTLKAAYSFYNVSTATPWKILMKDVLITAKNSEFDVFNALDLMENSQFLDELKFGQGDGNLQYYLYNWRCPNMTPQKVGFCAACLLLILMCWLVHNPIETHWTNSGQNSPQVFMEELHSHAPQQTTSFPVPWYMRAPPTITE